MVLRSYWRAENEKSIISPVAYLRSAILYFSFIIRKVTSTMVIDIMKLSFCFPIYQFQSYISPYIACNFVHVSAITTQNRIETSFCFPKRESMLSCRFNISNLLSSTAIDAIAYYSSAQINYAFVH